MFGNDWKSGQLSELGSYPPPDQPTRSSDNLTIVQPGKEPRRRKGGSLVRYQTLEIKILASERVTALLFVRIICWSVVTLNYVTSGIPESSDEGVAVDYPRSSR